MQDYRADSVLSIATGGSAMNSYSLLATGEVKDLYIFPSVMNLKSIIDYCTVPTKSHIFIKLTH